MGTYVIQEIFHSDVQFCLRFPKRNAAILSSKYRRQLLVGNAFPVIFISSVQYNHVIVVSHSRLLLLASCHDVNEGEIAEYKIKKFVPMTILRTDEFYEKCLLD